MLDYHQCLELIDVGHIVALCRDGEREGGGGSERGNNNKNDLALVLSLDEDQWREFWQDWTVVLGSWCRGEHVQSHFVERKCTVPQGKSHHGDQGWDPPLFEWHQCMVTFDCRDQQWSRHLKRSERQLHLLNYMYYRASKMIKIYCGTSLFRNGSTAWNKYITVTALYSGHHVLSQSHREEYKLPLKQARTLIKFCVIEVSLLQYGLRSIL